MTSPKTSGHLQPPRDSKAEIQMPLILMQITPPSFKSVAIQTVPPAGHFAKCGGGWEQLGISQPFLGLLGQGATYSCDCQSLSTGLQCSGQDGVSLATSQVCL